MTLGADDLAAVTPQWRTVRLACLGGREVQVRRPTVRDVSRPVDEMWTSLVRDADGTPLVPTAVDAGSLSPDLANEVVQAAMDRPTEGGAP